MSWICGEQSIRELWGLDPSVAFLNHGSYGAVPHAVHRERLAVIQNIEKNPADFIARQLPQRISEQRRNLAAWLNAQPQTLAFVPNATSGIGAVLASLSWQPGDEIVFHSHGYGWVRQGLSNLAARYRVVVKEAHIPWPRASDDLIVSSFEEQMSERTKLLICDHVSSPTALAFPLKRIISAAHARGVRVLVDGAHAPGFLPLDIGILGPDFYVGNLHKWVCAPRGAAFLYVNESHRDAIRPESLCYSGGIAHHSHSCDFVDYFDWTGTTDFSAWLSIAAALEFNAYLGWTELFRNRRQLLLEAKRLLITALNLNHVQIGGDENAYAMLTLPWPLRHHIEPSIALARILSEWLLREHRVEVPVLCFENRIYFRVSVQAYNCLDEYQRLAQAIALHPYSLV